jgi:hypothetical protein
LLSRTKWSKTMSTAHGEFRGQQQIPMAFCNFWVEKRCYNNTLPSRCRLMVFGKSGESPRQGGIQWVVFEGWEYREESRTMRDCLKRRVSGTANRRGRVGFQWVVLWGWEYREKSGTLRVCLKKEALERANLRGRKRFRVARSGTAGIGRGSSGHG